jgi:hypothetical protein
MRRRKRLLRTLYECMIVIMQREGVELRTC